MGCVDYFIYLDRENQERSNEEGSGIVKNFRIESERVRDSRV